MADPENDVAEEERINGSQAARLLGVDVSTLSRWRKQNRGPNYEETYGRVKYRRKDVIAFIRNSRVETQQ